MCIPGPAARKIMLQKQSQENQNKNEMSQTKQNKKKGRKVEINGSGIHLYVEYTYIQTCFSSQLYDYYYDHLFYFCVVFYGSRSLVCMIIVSVSIYTPFFSHRLPFYFSVICDFYYWIWAEE